MAFPTYSHIERHDAAFEEGNAAYHAGKLPQDNPYMPSMTDAHEAERNRGWFNGWYGERHDTVEGLAAVFHQANSGVTTTGITRGYLRESCKRVSKAEAFRVHPALAERMKD